MRVKVPQKDGEIVQNRAGDTFTYKVTNHYVEVEDDDVEHFLSTVDGAEAAGETRRSEPKE